MPVVPFSKAPAPRPQRELPPEPFALMAAAQMHSEGRLVAPTPNIEDRRDWSEEQTRHEMGKDALRNAMVPETIREVPATRMARDLGIDQIKGREVKVYDSIGKRLKKDQQ